MTKYTTNEKSYYQLKEALEQASKDPKSEIPIRKVHGELFPIFHVANGTVKLAPFGDDKGISYIYITASSELFEREAISALEHLTDKPIKLRKKKK